MNFQWLELVILIIFHESKVGVGSVLKRFANIVCGDNKFNVIVNAISIIIWSILR